MPSFVAQLQKGKTIWVRLKTYVAWKETSTWFLLKVLLIQWSRWSDSPPFYTHPATGYFYQPYIMYGEILSCKSAMEKWTLPSSWLIMDTLPLFLDPSDYSLVQPVPLHHHNTAKNAQRLCVVERYHTYSFVGQPTNKNKLHRRRLLCCIHDCLAFDDIAARQSCGSYWRQLSALVQACTWHGTSKFAYAHFL